jgi:hypothetical protein
MKEIFLGLENEDGLLLRDCGALLPWMRRVAFLAGRIQSVGTLRLV